MGYNLILDITLFRSVTHFYGGAKKHQQPQLANSIRPLSTHQRNATQMGRWWSALHAYWGMGIRHNFLDLSDTDDLVLNVFDVIVLHNLNLHAHLASGARSLNFDLSMMYMYVPSLCVRAVNALARLRGCMIV